jgi:hypothetical protein
MQTGLLFFQSLPDDLSLSPKKESQDPGSVTRLAEKGRLPENSIFLSTLKQIAADPQRTWLNSGLFESLLLAPASPPTDNSESKPIIQGRSDGAFEWLKFFMNYALGFQNPEDGKNPASTDFNDKASSLSYLKDFGPVASEAHGGTPLLDPVSQTTESGADAEALITQLKSQILNILNVTQDVQVPDLSALSPTQMDESDAEAAKFFSVFENRIIDFLKTNPNPQPSDPLTKTDPAVSDGLNKKNPLYALISDLLHGRETSGSMPIATTAYDNFQLPDPAITPQGPDSDNGRYDQALLVKLLSYLQGRQKGIENNPSGPIIRANGVNHSEDLTTAPPKTNTGIQNPESVPEKIILDAGDRYNERDHVSKFGLDFRQRMKQTTSGAIATGAKDAAATHLKAAVAVPPPSDQNRPIDHQAARDGDIKAGLFQGAEIKTPTSETGTLSSEAEKDSHDFKDSGPRINFADRFIREDAGDRAARVIPENGDKASPFSNNRGSESLSETASSAKDPDPAANFSRTGTLSQIVEKAAFNLKDGQSELRLNLKPDFLGRIHMRIVTENHQVTLKISTEFLAVKEIIENNIHQLKADLQNHGLEINSLDVSVTKDSHQQGSGHQPASQLKANSDAGAKSGRDDHGQKELSDPNSAGEENGSDNAIDYFA